MRLVSIFFVLICSCGSNSDGPTNNQNNANNSNNLNNNPTNSNNQNNENNTNNQNSQNNQNNTNNTNQSNCTVPLGPDRDFDGVEDANDIDPDDPFDYLTWSAQGSTRHQEATIPKYIATTWDGTLLFENEGATHTVRTWKRNSVTNGSINSTNFSPAVELSTNDGSGDIAIFSATSDLPNAMLANPFPSDATGSPNLNGTHKTYKLGVVGTTNSPVNSPSRSQLTRSTATVIVNTVSESIESTSLDSIPVPISAGSESLWGDEPTVSIDGKLIVWSGVPNNQFEGRAILYSFNPTPQLASGWSAPANIAALYLNHGKGAANEMIVDGVEFSDRYPIANRPIRENGQELGPTDLLLGQHPKLSPDTTELFFAAVATFQGTFDSAVVAVGVRTDWTIRHLDGAMNPSRSTLSINESIVANGLQHDALVESYDLTVIGTEPVGPSGFARSATPILLSGTMWTPFLGNPDPPLPRNGLPETYAFALQSGRYVEASMPEAFDQHRVVALSMNEKLAFDRNVLNLIQTGAIASGPAFEQAVRQAVRFDARSTPDVSGNEHHATLNANAAFPYEYRNAQETWTAYWSARQNDPTLPATRDGVAGDVIEGIQGNAILFPGASSVTTDLTSDLARFTGDMTIQFWVKPFSATAADLARFDQISIALDSNLRITGDVDGSTISSTEEVSLNEWNLIVLRFTEDDLSLHVNGAALSIDLPNAIIPTSGDVVIGPADVAASDDALYILDEFSISDVARTKDELRQSAFSRRAIPTLRGSDFGAPAPFDVLPAYSPRDEVPGDEIVELGRALFETKQLSDDRSMACSTCHDPEKGFADNEMTAIGVFGRSNDRNSQTVVNRLFSTAQFWDGRSPSTEAQALGPIQAETEMNLSIPDALDRLNDDPEFSPLFAAAHGSICIDRARLARSMGAFVRTLIAPTTRFDSRQLNSEEQWGETLFFGKARCSNCHFGATFTDERFHNPGFDVVIASDRGRERITGRVGDLARFKTPTLRELVHTAPYFHDGSFDALEDVVFFYNTGGVTELNRDFAIRPLGLSIEEEAALVAFLRTLSSE